MSSPVGLAQLERDPRRLLRAIADGREDGLHPRAEDRALLQLQSLGERERRGGGREQGDHQHRRGDTSHWRGILVFAAWRAVQWLRSDDGARGRSIRRHVGDRRTRAALQPGDDRDPRAGRDHSRPVVAARPARAAARRRADLRPPLVSPVLRVFRARSAAAGRRAARGRAAAPRSRTSSAPSSSRPRALRLRPASRRRERRSARSLPCWRCWPRATGLLRRLRGLQARLPAHGQALRLLPAPAAAGAERTLALALVTRSAPRARAAPGP